MRVLMSLSLYTMGGASTVVDNLALNLVKKGTEVVIGALKFEKRPPEGLETMNLLDITGKKSSLKEFDVIHSHHPLTNYLALFTRGLFVYHYHGSPDLGKNNLANYSLLFSIKTMQKRFDALIAVSKVGADELKAFFQLKNIYTIYNGVDTKIFSPLVSPNFRRGNPQLLFVGNLYSHKNVEELIFAVNSIVKKYPEINLQIIGRGSEETRLAILIETLALQNNVELLGHVSEADLPHYYASCDLYVTASKWELFGLPLLEAMSCGKPVVASSICPHAELVSKSGAGALFHLGQKNDLIKKICYVYENSSAFSLRARTFAEQFDWATVADQIRALYEKHILLKNCNYSFGA